MKFSLSMTLLLLLVNLLNGANDTLADRANAQRNLLWTQISLIQDELQLDDRLITKMVNDMESEIEAAAKRIEAKIEDPEFEYVFDSELESGLETAFLKIAKEQVPESKFEAFESQFLDIKKLRRQWNRNGQRAVVSFIDETLSLSAEQEAAILNILKNHWHADWNGDVENLVIDGADCADQALNVLTAKDVESILTAQQWKLYQDLYSFRVEMEMMENGEIDLQVLRTVANQLMELRVEELVQRFELSDSQKKMLSVARKGAVTDLLEQWQALKEKYADNPDQMYMNLEALELATQSFARQGTSQRKWKSILSKTLSESQLELVEQRERYRLERIHEQLRCYLIRSTLTAHQDIELSFQQYNALTELLKQEIDLDDSAGLVNFIFVFIEIDDSKLEPIFSKSQWEKVQPNLLEERQMLRQMKESQDEVDETEAEDDES